MNDSQYILAMDTLQYFFIGSVLLAITIFVATYLLSFILGSID